MPKKISSSATKAQESDAQSIAMQLLQVLIVWPIQCGYDLGNLGNHGWKSEWFTAEAVEYMQAHDQEEDAQWWSKGAKGMAWKLNEHKYDNEIRKHVNGFLKGNLKSYQDANDHMQRMLPAVDNMGSPRVSPMDRGVTEVLSVAGDRRGSWGARSVTVPFSAPLIPPPPPPPPSDAGRLTRSKTTAVAPAPVAKPAATPSVGVSMADIAEGRGRLKPVAQNSKTTRSNTPDSMQGLVKARMFRRRKGIGSDSDNDEESAASVPKHELFATAMALVSGHAVDAEVERSREERKIREAEELARARKEYEAREQAEAAKEAKAQAAKEAKAQAEKEAKAQAEKEAKAQAEKEAKAKAEKEAKAQAEKEAKSKAKADKEAKAKVDEESKRAAGWTITGAVTTLFGATSRALIGGAAGPHDNVASSSLASSSIPVAKDVVDVTDDAPLSSARHSPTLSPTRKHSVSALGEPAVGHSHVLSFEEARALGSLDGYHAPAPAGALGSLHGPRAPAPASALGSLHGPHAPAPATTFGPILPPVSVPSSREVEELRAHNNTLTEGIKARNAQIHQLLHEKANQNELIATLQLQATQQTARISELESRLDGATKAAQKFQTESNAKDATIEELRNNNAPAGEIQRLRDALANAQKSLSELDVKRREADTSADHWKQSVDIKDREITRLTNLLGASSSPSHHSTLQLQLDRVMDENQRMQESITRYSQSDAEVRAEKAKLDAENTSLRQQLDQLKSENLALQTSKLSLDFGGRHASGAAAPATPFRSATMATQLTSASSKSVLNLTAEVGVWKDKYNDMKKLYDDLLLTTGKRGGSLPDHVKEAIHKERLAKAARSLLHR